jgi:DNA-binding response OmpR family regulator
MQEKDALGCALIVEDPMIRRLVGGILKREGYAVIEAELEEALRTLRDAPGTVSLLVTNVPGDFFEFAETLPVIYVAAFPDPALAGRFRHCRALRKPFRPGDLALCAAELAPPVLTV